MRQHSSSDFASRSPYVSRSGAVKRTDIVVVCGLAAEARIARAGLDGRVIAGGGDARRLVAELAAALPFACGVVSFGVAGGLAPELRPGDLRVASRVVAPDGTTYAAHAGWSAALATRLAVPLTIFAGADVPLSDVSGKAALHAATGAATVDMESHLVAAFARANGLPFAAIRAVTDPAERALPPSAVVGMRADGQIDLPAVLRSLAKRPGELPALIRTGRDARAALAALLRGRQLLGPRFASLDLGDPRLHMS